MDTLCAQGSFLAAFLADERLKAFMRAGQLELVLWDHLDECVGPPHMRCWQPIVHSHAILEAWGGSAYLLIIDNDEYFALPVPDTTLAGALEGCTEDGKPMARPNISCDRPARPDPHAWTPHLLQQPRNRGSAARSATPGLAAGSLAD